MKKKSRILTEMHESAHDLFRSGAIDKKTMREYDLLYLPLAPTLSPRKIRAIRNKSEMSQAVFAKLLNTSVSAVQKWEIGEKRPSGPSLRLLDVIERKGVDALM